MLETLRNINLETYGVWGTILFVAIGVLALLLAFGIVCAVLILLFRSRVLLYPIIRRVGEPALDIMRELIILARFCSPVSVDPFVEFITVHYALAFGLLSGIVDVSLFFFKTLCRLMIFFCSIFISVVNKVMYWLEQAITLVMSRGGFLFKVRMNQ